MIPQPLDKIQSIEFPHHLSHNSPPTESIISFYFDEQISSHENVDQEPTSEAGMLQPEKTAPPNDYSRKRSNTTDASNSPKKLRTPSELAREPPPETESKTTDAALGKVIEKEPEAIANFQAIVSADARVSHDIFANQTVILEESGATPSCESTSGDTIVNTPVEAFPELGYRTESQSDPSVESNESVSPHDDTKLPVSTGAWSEGATPSVGSHVERSLTTQLNNDLVGPEPVEAIGVALSTSQKLGTWANPIPVIDDNNDGDVSSVSDADAACNNRKDRLRQKSSKKTDKPSMVDCTSSSHKEQLDKEVQNSWNQFLAYAYLVNPYWARESIETAVVSSLGNGGFLTLKAARQLIDNVDPQIKRARADVSRKIRMERSNPNMRARYELGLIHWNDLSHFSSRLNAAVTSREDLVVEMVEGGDDNDDYEPRNRRQKQT
ncbi:unnamed protein product [Periconia digitata]|uniref:Uncharacterized protein n=1 Tax=Periconia digitata TaxID=1303443 RepID=A0A9W4UMM0_9PLEO|nr:unnamed protein product [Periconia digitata]